MSNLNSPGDKDGNGILDRNTILAVIIVGGFWFLWQSHMSEKYGHEQAPVAESQSPIQKEAATDKGGTTTAEVIKQTSEVIQATSADLKKEIEMPFENDVFNLKISSHGMAIKDVKLKKYTQRGGSAFSFTGDGGGLYPVMIAGKIVDFELSSSEPNYYVGKTKVGNYLLTRTISLDKDHYYIRSSLEVKAVDGPINSVELSLGDIREKTSTSILNPGQDTQEYFILHEDDKEDTVALSTTTKAVDAEYRNVKLASLESHYFAVVLEDSSQIMPEIRVLSPENATSFTSHLSYKAPMGSTEFKVENKIFIGPKDLAILNESGSNMARVIKFGALSAISKPLLMIMKWFYGIVGNWGLAIILLTILVRLVVMPLHIMSFRSMKKMQVIQPMIQALRDKYKEDPTTLNKEMMALMKTNKVNPMGGCLPMLLQMPVFFALYRVFGQSIELYQAPFFFWIHDLSLKDPFYVLPVLMAGVMFLQQKLTPTTADPAQAKMMQWMPLVFSFMMISLPSALTLYIFVSTLIGIIQQTLFLRDKVSTVTAKQANA